MSFLPADLVDAMKAAAPGGRIRARVSFLVQQINPDALSPPFQIGNIRPGVLVARMGCPDCTELLAVDDDAIEADWEAF